MKLKIRRYSFTVSLNEEQNSDVYITSEIENVIEEKGILIDNIINIIETISSDKIYKITIYYKSI